MNKPPLIVSAWLRKSEFEYLNGLRKQHFPPERNVIDAHLTLFHALPNAPEIIDTIRSTCARQLQIIARVIQPVSLGKGVALKVESPELVQLHTSIRSMFKAQLTPQDSQKLWPHVTVQNKVSVDQARQLLGVLSQDFQAFDLPVQGLQVWEYLEGPWRLIHEFPFVMSSQASTPNYTD